MAETRFTHPQVRSMPAYTFQKKYKQVVPPAVPGPGTYENSNVKDTNSNIAFSKSPRYKDPSPGPAPGQYDPIEKSKKLEFSFRGKGLQGIGKSTLPGPGNYEIKEAVNSPSFTFGSRLNPSGSVPNLGPGAYEAGNVFSKRSAKFGSTSRLQMPKNEGPGPGSYEYDGRKVFPSKSYGFGSKTDRGPNKLSPGPGAYDLKSTTFDRNGPMMRPRRNHDKNSISPGPGSYNVFASSGPQGYSLGKRDEWRPNDVPGPGEYEVKSSSDLRGSKFGSMSRSATYGTAIPGPGTYENIDMNSGKKITMKGRLSPPQRGYVPGPGEYDPKSSKQIDKISKGAALSKAPRGVLPNANNPGPGDYEASKTKDSPGWKFGSTERGRSEKKGYVTEYYDVPAAFPNAPR